MAIAGKVAITPGGEWSVDAAYDKLVVVTFGNNVYLSIKPSTGIEPTNEEYWMLLIENVTQEQYDNIINGTTTVGDANKLGGKPASEYALDSDLVRFDNTETLNTDILAKALTLKNGIYNYRIGGGNYPTGTGLPSENYRYSSNATIYYRSADAITVIIWGFATLPPIFNNYNGSKWEGWKTFATTADLAKYLPLSGGTVENNGYTLTLKRTALTLSPYLTMENGSGVINRLTVEPTTKEFLRSVDNKNYTILDTGNKPKGSYTGNGDATERTISVSGIGIGLLVIGNGCFTFISGNNAKIITDSGVKSLYSGVSINLITGTLKLSTTDVALNASGVGYTYQVL